MKPPEPLGQPTSICVGCGLCCDGTLYDHAVFGDEDGSVAKAVGIKVIKKAGERVFRLPCPNHSCGACSVYSRRPDICRSFRCKLLKDFDEGRVDAVEARERIEVAKRLAAAVHDAAPNAITPRRRSDLWREHADGFSDMDAEERQRSGRTILAIAALHHCLERWFWKSKRKIDSPEEVVIE